MIVKNNMKILLIWIFKYSHSRKDKISCNELQSIHVFITQIKKNGLKGKKNLISTANPKTKINTNFFACYLKNGHSFSYINASIVPFLQSHVSTERLESIYIFKYP